MSEMEKIFWEPTTTCPECGQTLDVAVERDVDGRAHGVQWSCGGCGWFLGKRLVVGKEPGSL